jgi:predicted esterase
VIDLTIALVLSVADQSTKPPSEPKTGTYTATFTERHPLSSLAEMTHRHPRLKPSDYELAQESFVVSVPASYKPEIPYGLLVFINSFDNGECPDNFKGLLEKRRLIWVAANKSGNERLTPARMGLALDAVHNMTKLYAIDPERIYVSGISGGGRVCSFLAPAYPDVFRGAIYLIGCNSLAAKPPPEFQERMKSVNGYVFLTGDNDFNLPGTKQVFEEYQRAHFARTTYLQVPGMGHEIPPGAWVDKGIAYLDEPLVAAAKTLHAQALGFQKRGKLGHALKAFLKVAVRAPDEPFGKEAAALGAELEKKRDEQLRNVRELIDAGKGTDAVPILEKLLRDYDDTAGPARELLKKARK